jgi:AMP deaminase
LYYFYTNIAALNNLRSSLGLNTFGFRPHSGEAGIIDHLVASFLTSESINHGIVLRKAPVLQYLFYISQIGLALSPLSNNQLFLDITKNPFLYFFETGMNVVLTTDDPLQFHITKEPLIEEYAIARQIWKLSSADLCEIAANSIRTSGYSDATKAQWLGELWVYPGPLGNTAALTNVPDIRCAYRYETLNNEMHVLTQLCF